MLQVPQRYLHRRFIPSPPPVAERTDSKYEYGACFARHYCRYNTQTYPHSLRSCFSLHPPRSLFTLGRLFLFHLVDSYTLVKVWACPYWRVHPWVYLRAVLPLGRSRYLLFLLVLSSHLLFPVQGPSTILLATFCPPFDRESPIHSRLRQQRQNAKVQVST